MIKQFDSESAPKLFLLLFCSISILFSQFCGAFYPFTIHLNTLQPPLNRPSNQTLFSPACAIVQTHRRLNSQRRDTNFFSARDISTMLNKANSCIKFWWCKAKPSIWASRQKKAEVSFQYILVEKRAYCVIMRVCLPSESTYGYLISLCHWAGWRLESQGFQGWDYAWRGLNYCPCLIERPPPA